MTPSEPTRKSRARRKSKPSFEIPPEVASPPAGGWAYRTEPAPAPAPEPAPVPAVTIKQQPAAAPAKQATSGALTGGMELVALGFTMMGRISLAAFTVFSMPLDLARRLLPSAIAGRRDGK